MIKYFRKLYSTGPCITFLGSSRFTEGHPYYEFTRKATGQYAKLGFTIMTGGGPSLMEAANRGAKEFWGKTVSCNIKLPVDQSTDMYLDSWVEAKHFFIRKILLVKYSFAFVVIPGGFGTMDKYFEALTLIQTGKIKTFPLIIFNTEYHKALIGRVNLIKYQGINEADAKFISNVFVCFSAVGISNFNFFNNCFDTVYILFIVFFCLLFLFFKISS